ncbi:TrmB family transcriptional regulator [Haloplanus rallus]|jgi:sugar-specific transcriptional regulator TrmB|uniref:TrmB family transcriptional regulator n=1 Tax=Haloplanus rallus TaxID=1816183 RepID=A0A6B9F0R2_9EURY|nr:MULTISPECIES: TrmB family transcriptional regulator [Haloplanus]QGX93795.1 TrmB family transcriptional regulator [Haloplanus rallus]
MPSDELRSSLTSLDDRFDFGEYEIETYLAVLEHGKLSAGEIADLTDVPQSRVYDTARALAEDGLVEIHETRPMQVVAVDPTESLAGFRSALDDLISALQRQYTEPARDTEAISLVKSKSTILRYLSEILESAEYELLASLSPELVGQFETTLREQREAGIATELLVSPASDVPDPSEFPYTELASTTRERRGVTTPIVAVADGERSVYTTREALADDGDRYGIIFNRSDLGFLVSAFLETVIWTSGRPLATANTTTEFPRQYGTIRRCVEDLQAADGGDLYAAVWGRDVVTGDDRRVTGRVVEVTLEGGYERAALTVDAGDELIEVGGRAAALEDVEAEEIHVGRTPFDDWSDW